MEDEKVLEKRPSNIWKKEMVVFENKYKAQGIERKDVLDSESLLKWRTTWASYTVMACVSTVAALDEPMREIFGSHLNGISKLLDTIT